MCYGVVVICKIRMQFLSIQLKNLHAWSNYVRGRLCLGTPRAPHMATPAVLYTMEYRFTLFTDIPVSRFVWWLSFMLRSKTKLIVSWWHSNSFLFAEVCAFFRVCVPIVSYRLPFFNSLCWLLTGRYPKRMEKSKKNQSVWKYTSFNDWRRAKRCFSDGIVRFGQRIEEIIWSIYPILNKLVQDA